MDAMTFRQMNLNVFRGEPLPHVFFQPRIEPWIHWHRLFGQLPPEEAALDMPAWFDRLDCSMRYVHYYTGMPNPIVREFDPAVKVREHFAGTEGTVVYETPLGDLVEELTLTPDQELARDRLRGQARGGPRQTALAVPHTTFRFAAEAFAQGRALVGRSGRAAVLDGAQPLSSPGRRLDAL